MLRELFMKSLFSFSLPGNMIIQLLSSKLPYHTKIQRYYGSDFRSDHQPFDTFLGSFNNYMRKDVYIALCNLYPLYDWQANPRSKVKSNIYHSFWTWFKVYTTKQIQNDSKILIDLTVLNESHFKYDDRFNHIIHQHYFFIDFF